MTLYRVILLTFPHLKRFLLKAIRVGASVGRQMCRKGQGGHSSYPDTEIFPRLAGDPADSESLVALYEKYENELKEAASRYFGRNEVSESAVHNILVALGRQARTYDPQSMNASEWVSRVADAEARRLREALDKAVSESLRARRAT